MRSRTCDEAISEQGDRGRLVLQTWAGVYPVLTLTAWVLKPVLAGLPVALQTLIMSAIMVPVTVLAVMPAMRRWFAIRDRQRQPVATSTDY